MLQNNFISFIGAFYQFIEQFELRDNYRSYRAVCFDLIRVKKIKSIRSPKIQYTIFAPEMCRPIPTASRKITILQSFLIIILRKFFCNRIKPGKPVAGG